ncbi:MAG: GNAT family N-acetyltransferase [Arcobacter sp.]|nr:GNAT family N-acetyltransferase [Arcobacter sp.]|tara:strand:- start:212 stop:685 length:474 start_codon:yes stop_codon:yes gene_type:complete
MNIEKATLNDTQEIAELFTNTIHKINIQNYTLEQIEVWAPIKIDYEKWEKRFKKSKPYIAKKENKIVGFFEFEKDGYIDCFYVHYNYQSQGIGSMLLNKIVKITEENNLDMIFANVSITAKYFFEKNNFEIKKKNIIKRDREELINYTMTRQMSNKT